MPSKVTHDMCCMLINQLLQLLGGTYLPYLILTYLDLFVVCMIDHLPVGMMTFSSVDLFFIFFVVSFVLSE